MDRDYAITIVMAEAFSETGLAVLVENGAEPGWKRINNLIGALNFLMDELADEDTFGREFVSALFVLGNRVPDLMRMRHPDSPNFRPSLYDQAEELTTAVTELIENWNHWPDLETYELRTYQFETPPEKSAEALQPERVGGYSVGDITYCMTPKPPDCFPVRVDRLGNGYLDVVPFVEGSKALLEFGEEAANRRFFYPTLSPGARFGGEDERLVNSERKSGPELRLLAVDYETTTFRLIRERHAMNPILWPLPTGLIYERWFQDIRTRGE